MSKHDMTRPAVMESITASELEELEVRIADNHKSEFEEIARNYGWDENTVSEAWRWLRIQAGHPSDPTAS